MFMASSPSSLPNASARAEALWEWLQHAGPERRDALRRQAHERMTADRAGGGGLSPTMALALALLADYADDHGISAAEMRMLVEDPLGAALEVVARLAFEPLVDESPGLAPMHRESA